MASNKSNNNAKSRLYILGAILVLWSAGICLRLVNLQIFQYGRFEHQANRQQQRTVEVSPIRGVVYDRAGRELAMSVAVDSIFAVPSEIHDLPSALSLIARITKDDPRELLARCKGKTFCWISRKADGEAVGRVRSLNLQGIHFQKESKRFYPKRELAAQVLGYVGMDDEGLSGIERQYESKLRGKPGRLVTSVDARGTWFGSVEKQPDPGENIVLTLDEQIQYIIERELEAAMQQTHAEAGTIIVQNPRTGEILGLANRPTFNPNVSRQITPQKLKDHAVSDVYEPGSTFKLVTISAALEEKLTNPNEVFDCQMGSIMFNGLRIRDSKPHGLLPVSGILAESSDVGSIKIALRLGEDRFYKYIRAYGFGQQTGIELPGETRGLTKPVSRWSKVSIGAISMGQEIGITPIQLASLISTIANDGIWSAPHVVAATGAAGSDPRTNFKLASFQPTNQRRVISPFTAGEMREMMQKVVLEGTGRKAILEGYSSAGKTGTAQKFDPAIGTYSRTKYIGSFAGFAPVNNPAVTIAVILDSAVGLHQGGQVSAPVFQRVAQQVLEYLHVPHDIDLPRDRQLLLSRRNAREDELVESSPDHLGGGIEVADLSATEPLDTPLKAAPKVGSVVAASLREPDADLKPLKEETQTVSAVRAERLPQPPEHETGTVVLDMEQGGVVVPAFLGKTVRNAVEAAQDAGLDMNAVGSGLAKEQTPQPGARVSLGSRVTVRFGR